MTDLADAIARAEAHSPFLRGLLRREEALVQLMEAEGPEAALARSMERLSGEVPMTAIRSARAGVALTVALADLSGQWRLEQVTEALTAFADQALQTALATAFAERSSEVSGITALALGKMGSRELNYSSDIDLIFIHDSTRIPCRSGEDPTEAAVRIVRRTSQLLAERTGDGYALRVDLRLRPDPDSTPSSLPIGAAVHYYQSQALAWERSAFIRARAAAGDIGMGESFLREIEPFIWRRSLDYSALAEIRDVSHQIRDHFAEGQKLGPGFDLKRGRGGIREVEFYAQVHQMLFGGRDPSIRSGATLDALSALARAGRIEPDEARQLGDCYRYYRDLEHRFQMLADQQTHSVPRSAPEREAVARLAGAASWKDIEQELAPRLKLVARIYDRLLASSGEDSRSPRIPTVKAEIERWASKAKAKDPQLVATIVEGWRSGRPRSLRVPEAVRAFEAVVPSLIQQVGAGRSGREGLLRLDQFVQGLPSGVQFWRLLAANPPLMQTVGRLLTTTPLLADAVAKRPDLLDVLLEPSLPMPDIESARAELAQLCRGLSGEQLLDRVRQWTAERRFHIGVMLLDGHETPIAASRTLGLMAEATVELMANAVTAEFASRHGTVPDAGLVTLALGRFGGGELTAQSDLDLIFLFSGSFDSKSDGAQPLPASSWFNRLGQRLVAALTVPTAQGTLYQVDTRLRPSGADGLLVVSLDSFIRYQQQDAELWEAMALTRARAISGTEDDRKLVQQAIDSIVSAPRDRAKVLREAMSMRQHIARHKPAAGPFDVKLMKGGLIDIEFIAQARALTAGRPVPARLSDQLALLAPELQSPAELMMSVLVMLRLMQPHDSTAAPDAAAGAAIARACGHHSLAALRADLAKAREIVTAHWRETFKGAD